MGLLNKLGGRIARFRASMYADDAAIFLKPMTRDVQNIIELLISFGEVTGLRMNIQKTSIAAISCNGIDLNKILSELPVSRAGFPLKYLGLPLAIRRLKKLDFPPLYDKAARKLSN